MYGDTPSSSPLPHSTPPVPVPLPSSDPLSPSDPLISSSHPPSPSSHPPSPSAPILSIVIPAYNEEDNVEKMVHDLSAVLGPMGHEHEIIFVNDGSTDATLPRLLGMIPSFPAVRVIDLACNSGQTAATLAGFHHATGGIVITMDGDLQHYPEDIPKMVDAIESGYHCIGSWRYDRSHERFGKRVPSKISNILALHLTGTRIHDFGSGFKAYRIECVRDLELYGSFHRYIPAIIRHRGYRVSEIRIHWRERYGGKTKYGSSRLLKGLRDLLYISITTRFRRVPGSRFLAGLMVKVNYDGGRPTYTVRELYNFPQGHTPGKQGGK